MCPSSCKEACRLLHWEKTSKRVDSVGYCVCVVCLTTIMMEVDSTLSYTNTLGLLLHHEQRREISQFSFMFTFMGLAAWYKWMNESVSFCWLVYWAAMVGSSSTITQKVWWKARMEFSLSIRKGHIWTWFVFIGTSIPARGSLRLCQSKFYDQKLYRTQVAAELIKLPARTQGADPQSPIFYTRDFYRQTSRIM